MKGYYIYILASDSKTLYIGVTNSIERRLFEHKDKLYRGFTKDHDIHKLVYYESYESIYEAIKREKQLKNWHRQRKVDLIEGQNPDWEDLSLKW